MVLDMRLRLINNSSLESERNICYVNSAVQLMFNIPRLTKMFEEREYRLKGEEDRTMKICDELSRLFNARGSAITSAAVLRQLVRIASHKQQFLDGSQQDILDFLFTLLGEIEKEISHSNWEAKV